MSTIEKSIDVDVPVRVAYNQWTQMESYPKFMKGVEEVRQLDDTRTHWKVDIAGVEREFDSEISDQVPDEHIAWHSIGELDHKGRVNFEKLGDDHTRVTLTMEWQPEGFVEKAGDTLKIDDAEIARDLQRFKELIEDRDNAEGAWRGEIHGGDTVDKDDNQGTGGGTAAPGL